MDLQDEIWEFDELKTMKTILHHYLTKMQEYEKKSKKGYISRDEYFFITNKLIYCVDQIVDQNERFIDCIEKLTTTVESLTSQMIDIQQRLEDEGI